MHPTKDPTSEGNLNRVPAALGKVDGAPSQIEGRRQIPDQPVVMGQRSCEARALQCIIQRVGECQGPVHIHGDRIQFAEG